MKRVITVFALMLCTAAGSFAQTTSPSKQDIMAQRAATFEQVAMAGKEAGLTEDEAGKLKAIFETLFKKQDQIKADSALTAEVKKEKLKEANSEKDWKIKYTLGSKYTAFMEARKKLMAAAAPKKE